MKDRFIFKMSQTHICIVYYFLLDYPLNNSFAVICNIYITANSTMNSQKPAQLADKVEYLHDKIDFVNKQVRQGGSFELKMKFIDFVDTTIERLYQLDSKKAYSSEAVKAKYEEYYNSEKNERQRTKLETEKEHLSQRLKQLHQKQKNLQVQSLRIQLQNSKLLKENLHREYGSKQTALKSYIHELQNKIKAQQKQIQRIIKINTGLAKQNQMVKEERNRAEKSCLQWKQKYKTQIGVLEIFDNKGSKYAFRDESGIRVLRTFTNVTTERKGCQRLVFCNLPLKLQVLRLSYGIKIGIVHINHEIEYFNQLSLYEKEEMIISNMEGAVVAVYIKRKVRVHLDKYKLGANNQVVIMLFGQGDSIAVDETAQLKI